MQPTLLLLLAISFATFHALSAQPEEPKSRLVESYKPAKLLKKVEVSYPPHIARSRQDGWVQLSFVIDQEGQVKDITPLDNGGSDAFIDEAVRAVAKWQFEPAMEDGKPIEQCSNNLQVNFMITNGGAIGNRFNRHLKKAQKALTEKNYADALTRLEAIDKLDELNMTELFWRNYMGVQVNAGLNRPEEKYRAIKQALNSLNVIGSKDRSEVRRYLLQHKFIYETKNAKFADALMTLKQIRKHAPKLVKPLKPYIKYINQNLSSDKLITVKVDKKEGGLWRHRLVRNEFAFANLEGEINKLEVRCQKKRSIFTFDINSSWKIPKSWGKCSLFLDTADNTKFTLVETNS